MRTFILSFVALFLAADALAMTAEPVKLAVWKRGETIVGDDFVAANEAVVDYIATLRRPTELLKAIKYNCMAKARVVAPDVYPAAQTSGGLHQRVQIVTVYELRDCVEAIE